MATTGTGKLTIDDFETILTAEQIDARVREMGAEIGRDFAGEALTAIGILKGSLPFMADLIRFIDVPLECDFLRVASYNGGTETSGIVRLEFDLTRSITDKHVLIVEDIIDTGLTMNYLLETLAVRHPASLKVASLLHKTVKTVTEVKIDYLGFEIPDRFVIGYGLDYDELYRNLPDIRALRA